MRQALRFLTQNTGLKMSWRRNDELKYAGQKLLDSQLTDVKTKESKYMPPLLGPGQYSAAFTGAAMHCLCRLIMSLFVQYQHSTVTIAVVQQCLHLSCITLHLALIRCTHITLHHPPCYHRAIIPNSHFRSQSKALHCPRVRGRHGQETVVNRRREGRHSQEAELNRSYERRKT